ncbi:hypothetical protein ACOMHN_045095 [Nucella lapillus]
MWRPTTLLPAALLLCGMVVTLSAFALWPPVHEVHWTQKTVTHQSPSHTSEMSFQTESRLVGGARLGSAGGIGRDQTKPRSEERLCYLGLDGPGHLLPCRAEEQPRPRVLPPNTSIIETQMLPSLMNLYPEIGNGHVATVIRSNTVYMNGLYNGANITSHRARIPSTAAVLVQVVTPNQSATELFRLDIGRGVFSDVYTGNGFSVEVRRYAHRELTRLLVTEVIVHRTTFTLPITLSLTVNTGKSSEDVNFVHEKLGTWQGRTKEAEYPQTNGTLPVTVLYSVAPPTLTFPAHTQGSAAFLTSVSPFKADAVKYFNEGKARFLKGTLFTSHVNAWEGLWRQGRIEMTGNDSLALATNAAMYYLLSALPLQAEDADWPFVGMAPGGLAHGGGDNDYMGHVFWDQDTWMFPAIALLHGDLGRVIVGSRLRTLGAALLHAQRTGLKGARYPWESAFTGLPTSPSYDTQTYEIHVTGDVAWMMRQYLQLTNDTAFLTRANGYKALASIADFWISRSVFNQTRKTYEILDVMGPDEYHNHVNNSVYTNVIAVQSLRTAQYAAALTEHVPDPRWEEVASHMFINVDSEHNYHPEYDGYERGAVVKQADVILLGFPFRWPMSDDLRRNDLAYYTTVTPGGPAMTRSMFAVNWLRLGEQDKAHEAFCNSMLNVQEPFKVWSENADGSGAYNFHTGMGGFLQSLLYGYLGLDLNDHGLDLRPQLPPSLAAMAVRGVDYLGGSLDVAYDAEQLNVTLTKVARSPLVLVAQRSQQRINLKKAGTTVTLSRQSVSIQPSSSEGNVSGSVIVLLSVSFCFICV